MLSLIKGDNHLARKKVHHKVQDFSTKQQSKVKTVKDLFKPVAPRTQGQEELFDAIKENIVTIASGPPGSGKSLCAMSLALQSYFKGEVFRIVIVRPTIMAGDDQDLGALPGELENKMDPFLRPLLKDAAGELISYNYNKSSHNGSADPLKELLLQLDIEIVPLAYIRGRSFNNAFIILDEAQNCTYKDLKLFLTRIGKKCIVVVEGDVTQTDIPDSGLAEVMERLEGTPDIGVVRLSNRDVLRSEIVSRIIEKL